jgi:hypothetical protein
VQHGQTGYRAGQNDIEATEPPQLSRDDLGRFDDDDVVKLEPLDQGGGYDRQPSLEALVTKNRVLDPG